MPSRTLIMNNGLQLYIEDDAEAMSVRAAGIVARALSRKADLVMCLAAGRTQLRTYELLIDMHQKGHVSFSRATLFAIDEYVGPPDPGDNSLRQFLYKAIVSRIDLAPGRFHFLNPAARDIQGECLRYERSIRNAGGLDFALLGIGVNGHIGFNEPGSPWSSRTRPVVLTEETIRCNAGAFGGVEATPRRAITMGIATLLEAREVLLLASGVDKSGAVRSTVLDTPSESVPASALQGHGNCSFVVDAGAATLLPFCNHN